MEKCFRSYLALDTYILLCNMLIINQFSGAESITNIKQWKCCLDDRKQNVRATKTVTRADRKANT